MALKLKEMVEAGEGRVWEKRGEREVWYFFDNGGSRFFPATTAAGGDGGGRSEHDDFDYFTPVGKNPVYRKLIVDDVNELINVDNYKCKKNLDMDDDDIEYMEKKNMDDDDIEYMKKEKYHKKEEGDCKGKGKMNDDDFCREEKMNISDDDVDDDDMSFDKKGYGFSKSNMNSVVPCVGMFFNTLDEAEIFYRDYGRSVGFEIIIRSTHRHSREHDHDMVTSDKVQFMQRSKNIDPVTRALLELFDKSGIETAKAMRFLAETWGGVEKLGFSNQDVRNVIRDIRRRVFDSGDAGSGMALLR
ncbi:hypothetical protein AgCh_034898 [Apium graveolens]